MNLSLIIFLCQSALGVFGIVCIWKMNKYSNLSIASRDKEISDLKSKLLLSNNHSSPELSESGIEIRNKNEHLLALRKAQQALNEKIVQLEVECEMEQLLPSNKKLLIESP